MKKIMKLPFVLLGRLILAIFVGLLSAIFCVYTVDYLLSSAYGVKNLVRITVYFAFVCTLSVVSVLTYVSLKNKSAKKTKVKKETEKYSLK